jgi:hypothetical protein
MTATLAHRFDVLRPLAAAVDLGGFASLEELADRLWLP